MLIPCKLIILVVVLRLKKKKTNPSYVVIISFFSLVFIKRQHFEDIAFKAIQILAVKSFVGTQTIITIVLLVSVTVWMSMFLVSSKSRFTSSHANKIER
jgi:hypothetical protein